MFCAFTSHEPEFDYLKSLEIEEKINAVCWLPTVNNSLHLLSTNGIVFWMRHILGPAVLFFVINIFSFLDKVIKLWRMAEQSPFAYNFNFRADDKESESGNESGILSETSCITTSQLKSENGTDSNSALKKALSCSSLRIPRYRKRKNLTIEVRPRRIYASAHTYHINAISVNSDQETFLSADDLRINLWHLNVPDQSFSKFYGLFYHFSSFCHFIYFVLTQIFLFAAIVDIKPENMENLNEVITCSRFHPELCNILGYSTCRGVVRLCDMRVGALCDNHVLGKSAYIVLNEYSFLHLIWGLSVAYSKPSLCPRLPLSSRSRC